MNPDTEMPTLDRDRLADALDVVRDRVLAGPNRWRREPTITGDVVPGALAAHPALLAEALARLREDLPDLPALPEPAADDGAAWAHALAMLAVALQRASGGDAGPWTHVAPGDAPGSWAIAIGYDEEDTGLAAVRSAARMLRRVVRGDRADVAGVLGDLRARREREMLGPTSRAIVAAARQRGIPVRRSPDDPVVQLGMGCRLHRLDGILTDRTSVMGVAIAADTERALNVLARLGVPVPRRDDPPPRGHLHRVLVVAGHVVAVAERVPVGREAGSERAIDRTDEIHPENVAICAFAADAVGLDVAGLDVITTDITRPFRETGATIIEVNASPGIRMHTEPVEGTPRDVPGALMDALFPPGTPSRIPLVAVTGTNGKTTTTRLVAHLLRQAGHRVGFTTTDGVYHGEQLIFAGDMTGPMAADMVLSNPRIDAAVLETARGGILRAGLGFDEADVGVVLNVSADHLGLRGIHTVEQLADVKGVVAAIVKREGHAVLNADDPLVYGMRERTAADVVLVSVMAPGANKHVEDHIARNGIAARVEEDTFVLRRGRLKIPIAPVRDVPLMLGGAAKFQRQNILAAIATAYVQGMRYDDIRAGLLSFFPSPSLTPGRLNLMRIGTGRVLVDYAHNPAAVGGLMELALGLPATRRIGVITGPGDRRDEDLRELGRLCAQLDEVIIKEDEDRRGRQPGEIARIIGEGLVQGGMAAARISVVPDEGEAVERAVGAMGDGDLTVVLVEDVPGILERLRGRAAPATV